MCVHIYKDKWVTYAHTLVFLRFSFTFVLLDFVPEFLHTQGKPLSYIPSYQKLLTQILIIY